MRRAISSAQMSCRGRGRSASRSAGGRREASIPWRNCGCTDAAAGPAGAAAPPSRRARTDQTHASPTGVRYASPPRRMLSMNAFPVGALFFSAAVVAAQGLNPQAREVIVLKRALTGAEVASVLEASRKAVSGRVMHLAYQPDGPGPDFLMRSDGRPQYMRATSGRDFVSSWAGANGTGRTESGHVDVSSFTHYTGSSARGCDGTPRTGELVIEFENTGRGWTAKARTRGDSEVNGSAFA